MNRNSRILRKVKEQFILGLVVLLPLVLTAYILWEIFIWIDRILGKYLTHVTGAYIYGLGFAILVILIWAVGVLSHSPLGRGIVRHAKLLVFKAPIFGDVFKGIDTISTRALKKSKGSFENVVIVEYPKRDIYALGFLTSKDSVKFRKAKSLIDIVPVFVPTTPNPTSGILCFFEKKNIHPIEMGIDEAMETIISLGFVHPAQYRRKKI